MGQTVVEKIIAHNIGRDSVKAGEIVTVQVDRVMMDDIMIPFIVDKFKEMGFDRVFAPSHDLEDVCQLMAHDINQRHDVDTRILEEAI